MAIMSNRMNSKRYGFLTRLQFPKTTTAFFAALAVLATTSNALAQGRGPGGGQPSHPSDYYRGVMPTTPVAMTLHGGKYLRTDANHFEFIIMPQQIRIYVYDKKMARLNAKDIKAVLSMQLPGEMRTKTFEFQYVAAKPEIDAQDYIAAAFDASQLPEKNMPVTFSFTNTAERRAKPSSFTPMISRADIRPYVMRVLYTKADAEKAAAQRTCPVTGAELNLETTLVKVLIGEHPVYLNRKEDVPQIRATPEKYLAQLQGRITR